ncbi:MAG TPA: phosphate signaling complex protein PhoU [Firmicutes bacterium]|nr:phosphate signaling complex protein PhoU [Bacillota bacterium]
MPRKVFTQELESLNNDLVKMVVMTEVSIDEAIRALTGRDIALAHKVIAGDDHIDELQRSIEHRCVDLFVSQAPVASDVRLLVSILKMTTDIERIADHASDISEMVLHIDDTEYAWKLDYVERLSEFIRQMLRDVTRSYINRDILLAKSVCAHDEDVDSIFHQAVSSLMELMAKEPKYIPQATNFMFIVKYMERIGDHCTNLAEWVIYNITGSFIPSSTIEKEFELTPSGTTESPHAE